MSPTSQQDVPNKARLNLSNANAATSTRKSSAGNPKEMRKHEVGIEHQVRLVCGFLLNVWQVKHTG